MIVSESLMEGFENNNTDCMSNCDDPNPKLVCGKKQRMYDVGEIVEYWVGDGIIPAVVLKVQCQEVQSTGNNEHRQYHGPEHGQ